MSITVSEESHQFAHTLITYFSANLNKKKTEVPPPPVEESVEVQYPKMETKTKYSLDYDKFQDYIEDTSKKTTPQDEEMKKMIDQNPYLSQIACSHDRRKERELYDKSTQEKLDNAEYFKNEGNKSMSSKDYEKSSFYYQKALIHFDYAFPDTEKEQSRFDKLKEQCHSNMALCKFHQHDYDESLTHCYQVLKLNNKNTKALFRRAKIALLRDQFEQCHATLQELEVLQSQDAEVKQLKMDLKQKVLPL